MTATDAQVRLIMRERKKGCTQEQAAVKANLLSRKTVSKYEKLGKLPSELKRDRTYRTRSDPFAEDWPELEKMLADAPELEAKTLFDWLNEHNTGKYQEGQLRTLQRRISNWRALNTEKLLTLDQVHQPGEVMETDGTSMNELGITIQGVPFPHILIHSVLSFSNWEWGRVVQTESLLAIRLGVQSALVRLGFVPKVHQTDNTTAATHNLGRESHAKSLEERGYNEEYLQLMAHYGMTPQTTHVGSPNENGDVESSHGAFKRAVHQHLLLRGSRDFESLEVYEAFLWGIMEKRNAGRQEKLAEELTQMRPLSVEPWPQMRELTIRVGNNGLLRVLNNGYTVPSGLKGKRVKVKVYEWHIEVWYANKCVDTLSRMRGSNRYQINYRHVIDTLLRKPGGFRNYRYREGLFPRAVFRQAWETLEQRFSPRKADLAYLRILKLAAQGLETDVAQALDILLTSPVDWDDHTVAELVQPISANIPELSEQVVNLNLYDQLLNQEACHVAA
jgi:transcriptional regulator with XRE-family HTH domain